MTAWRLDRAETAAIIAESDEAKAAMVEASTVREMLLDVRGRTSGGFPRAPRCPVDLLIAARGISTRGGTRSAPRRVALGGLHGVAGHSAQRQRYPCGVEDADELEVAAHRFEVAGER